MSNYVRYHGEGNRGPSPVIFGDLSKPQHDQIVGTSLVIYDDFEKAPVLASAGAQGMPYSYQDTGVLIQGSAGPADLSDELGVLEISTMDTAEDQGHVQFAYGGPCRIDNANGNTGAVRFEARVKTSDVTNNSLAYFVGLGTGPVADNYLVNTTGALIATKGFIGFRVLLDDGDGMDTVYQAASQTLQVVKANAVTVAANTWMKLGFVYDPTAPDAEKITFYKDGVALADKVTTTNIDAATFPEGEALTPMVLCISGAQGLTDKLSVDWVVTEQEMDCS